jgi:predicted RNA-binding Zn-ribbon protein involved in translation (DUF1610 family)
MGIIDKTQYEFECPNCKIKEQVRILDKGSEWSGSHWQNGPSLNKFDVIWSGGEKEEPCIENKKCKKCGTDPIVRLVY